MGRKLSCRWEAPWRYLGQWPALWRYPWNISGLKHVETVKRSSWKTDPTVRQALELPYNPEMGEEGVAATTPHGQWVTPAFFKLPGRWSSIMSRTGKTGGILDTMSPKWDSIWNLQYWGSLNNYALSAPWIFANQPGWRGTCFFQCSCFKLLRQMCRPAADRWGALWSGVVWSQGPGTWNDMLSNAGFLK